MENERPAVIFADGLFWERPPQNAPENLRGKLSVKVEAFVAFLEKHKSERGYVNLGLWKSKNDPDKLYFSLDQWKPTPSDRTPDPDRNYKPNLPEGVDYPIDDRDLPF